MIKDEKQENKCNDIIQKTENKRINTILFLKIHPTTKKMLKSQHLQRHDLCLITNFYKSFSTLNAGQQWMKTKKRKLQTILHEHKKKKNYREREYETTLKPVKNDKKNAQKS